MNVLLHFSSSGQWQGNASDVFVSSFAADPVLLGSGAIGTIVAPKTTIKLLRKDDGRREHGFWKNHRWWDRARRDDRDHHDDRVHDDRVHDDRDHDGRDHGDRDHDDDNGGYDWKSGDSNSKHGQGRNSANDVDFRGTLFAKHVVLSAQTRLVVEPFRSWPKVVSQGMDLGRPVPPSPANPRVLHRPPPLMATGAGATVQVREFIRWAAGAVPDEDEDIRQSVAGSRFNADIVHAFAAEVDASLAADWSRSLVAITLLGSMRAPSAEDYLTAFVRLPLPTTGTVGGHPFSSGTPVEAMTLTMLQAAAVDGLALIQTGSSKAEVRRLAREHPAASVRVESVRAYITNYGEAGREELRAILPPNERIAVDFFENRDRAGSTFDSRLQTFLSQHPEANNTVGD